MPGWISGIFVTVKVIKSYIFPPLRDQVNIPTPQKKQPPKTKALLGLKSIFVYSKFLFTSFHKGFFIKFFKQ